MAFKLVSLACLLAVAHAGIISQYSPAQVSHYSAPVQVHQYVAPAKVAIAAPVAHYAPVKVAHYEHEEEYGPAEYSFEYSVHDEHTGDVKSQKETRHGDQVEGEYSLVEPDGSLRVVKYTADDHSGFNAVVHRQPGQHPVQAKPVLVKPVLKVAAPVVYAQAAPAHHGYYSHSAPAQSYYH